MLPDELRAVFKRHLPTQIKWVGYTLLLGYVGVFFWFNDISVASVTSVDFLVGLLTTGPFIGAILFGGYWLQRNDFSSDRYPRIGGWFVGGMAAFLLLNLVMIAAWPADGTYNNVAWALFAASVGGAGGAGIGIFEARTIDRAIAAERHRVKREELEQRNEQLEEFASIVSHDLRNPLSIASGRVKLVQEEYESEDLDAVVSAHERMDAIIERTLALARSGQTIGDTEAVELNAIGHYCWKNVATADATINVDSSAAVVADRDRLRHLFENLFRNCVEHGAPRDGVAVSRDDKNSVSEFSNHSTGSRSQADDSVEHAGGDVSVRIGVTEDGFYIEDDGPGIPEADREDVFEVGHSTSDDGMGFGLRIVEQVVEAHGWEIDIAEGTDGGARFEITGVEFTQPSERPVGSSAISATVTAGGGY